MDSSGQLSQTHTHTHTHTQEYICVYLGVFIYICVCVCVCVYSSTCIVSPPTWADTENVQPCFHFWIFSYWNSLPEVTTYWMQPSFSCYFPTLKIQFEQPSTQKFFISFGFTILSEMLASEISRKIWNDSSKANHVAVHKWLILLFWPIICHGMPKYQQTVKMLL